MAATLAIVLDTETTGTTDPEVIEAAWAALGPPPAAEVGESWSGRFQPSKPVELGALATHHIMDEDLAGCPPSASFALPPGTAYVIGHNVDYDWAVAGRPDVRRVDTMAMAAATWPAVGKATQGALIYHLDRAGARQRLQGAHGAPADVRNCVFVVRHLLAAHPELGTWEAVWRYSEEARVPEVFTFGKHKGRRIADAPRDYLVWILRQPDFDPYVVLAVRRALGMGARRP